MVGDETEKLGSTHLATCESCQKIYHGMQERNPVPPMRDMDALKQLGKKLCLQKILSVLLVLLIFLSALFWGILYLTTPVYLTEKQAISGCSRNESGQLVVTFYPEVENYRIWNTPASNHEETWNSVTVLAWKTRLGSITNQNRTVDRTDANAMLEILFSNQNGMSATIQENCTQVLYASLDGREAERAVYGRLPKAGQTSSPGNEMRLCFWVSVCVGILLCGIDVAFRQRKSGKALLACGAALFCFACTVISVTGGNFASYHWKQMMIGALIAALPLWSSCLIGWKLWLLRK